MASSNLLSENMSETLEALYSLAGCIKLNTNKKGVSYEDLHLHLQEVLVILRVYEPPRDTNDPAHQRVAAVVYRALFILALIIWSYGFWVHRQSLSPMFQAECHPLVFERLTWLVENFLDVSHEQDFSRQQVLELAVDLLHGFMFGQPKLAPDIACEPLYVDLISTLWIADFRAGQTRTNEVTLLLLSVLDESVDVNSARDIFLWKIFPSPSRMLAVATLNAKRILQRVHRLTSALCSPPTSTSESSSFKPLLDILRIGLQTSATSTIPHIQSSFLRGASADQTALSVIHTLSTLATKSHSTAHPEDFIACLQICIEYLSFAIKLDIVEDRSEVVTAIAQSDLLIDILGFMNMNVHMPHELVQACSEFLRRLCDVAASVGCVAEMVLHCTDMMRRVEETSPLYAPMSSLCVAATGQVLSSLSC